MSQTRGAIQCRSNVLLRIRQLAERDLERSTRRELLDIAQQLRDDLFVLSVAAFRNIDLLARISEMVEPGQQEASDAAV